MFHVLVYCLAIIMSAANSEKESEKTPSSETTEPQGRPKRRIEMGKELKSHSAAGQMSFRERVSTVVDTPATDPDKTQSLPSVPITCDPITSKHPMLIFVLEKKSLNI